MLRQADELSHVIERRAGDRNRPMQLFRLRNMAARRVVRRGNAARSLERHDIRDHALYRQAVTLYQHLVGMT